MNFFPHRLTTSSLPFSSHEPATTASATETLETAYHERANQELRVTSESAHMKLPKGKYSLDKPPFVGSFFLIEGAHDEQMERWEDLDQTKRDIVCLQQLLRDLNNQVSDDNKNNDNDDDGTDEVTSRFKRQKLDVENAGSDGGISTVVSQDLAMPKLEHLLALYKNEHYALLEMMGSFESTALVIKGTLKRLLNVQGSALICDRPHNGVTAYDDQVTAPSSSASEDSSDTFSSWSNQHTFRITALESTNRATLAESTDGATLLESIDEATLVQAVDSDGAMSGSGVEEVREEVHIRHGQEETNSAVASSATPDATLTASFELKGQPTLLKSEQSDQGTEPVWARDHYNTIPTTMPEPNQQQQQQYPPQEVEIPYLSFTRDRINTNVSATAAAIKPSPPSIYIRPDVQLNDEKAADEDEDIILQEGKRLVRFDNWVSTLDDACSTAAHTTVYTSEKMTSAIVISKTRPMTRLNSLFIRRRTKRSDMAAGEADTASRKL